MITLKYIPPLNKHFYIINIVSLFVILLILELLYTRYGLIVIIIFSLIYAICMLLVFIFLSGKYYLKLDEEKYTLTMHKPFRKTVIDINDIKKIDIYETKKSYILSINMDTHSREFSLSGSLSFEEPPLIPFLRKFEDLNKNIVMGELCKTIVHGNGNFNPWSTKMYYTYWTYIYAMVGFYIVILIFINILK